MDRTDQDRAEPRDYGLGIFDGSPLVYVGTRRYHRHDHGGRIQRVTFTEEFAGSPANGWTPCRVCFPSA